MTATLPSAAVVSLHVAPKLPSPSEYTSPSTVSTSVCTSVALNRIAIAHAGSRKSNLGGIVLANGRFAIGERVKPVLEAGRAAGLLAFADSEATFRTFFGLVGRDIQIRLLLGETLDFDGAEIRRDAGRAVEQFLALYGQAKPDPNRHV